MSICDSCAHEKVCAFKEKTRKMEEKIPSLHIPVGPDAVVTIAATEHLSVEVKCKFRDEKTKPVNWRMKGRSPDLEGGVVK